MTNMAHGLGAKESLKDIIDADLNDLADGVVETVDTSDVMEMTLQDIYKQLILQEDIIIIIDAVDEPRVRKGLSSIKAKENAKLRDNNLPTDNSTLEFKVHVDEELKKSGRVRLQMFLKDKPTVKVHKLIVSDDL